MTQLGLSFSEQYTHLALLKANEVLEIDKFPHPFAFKFENLFTEDHMGKLGAILKQKVQDWQADGAGLAVALPMNFVHVKKVALPADASPELLRTQVEWELKNYLSDAIEAYKIVNTQIVFEYTNYNEHIFLAFKKSIIQHLSNLAESCGLLLQNIVPTSFLVSAALDPELNEQNLMVMRIGKSLIQTHLFIKGKYFYSYLDAIKQNGQMGVQTLFETCNQRIGETSSLLEQLPQAGGGEIACYIYGDNSIDELEAMLHQHVSYPVKKLVSTDKKIFNCGLEANQILLD